MGGYLCPVETSGCALLGLKVLYGSWMYDHACFSFDFFMFVSVSFI